MMASRDDAAAGPKWGSLLERTSGDIHCSHSSHEPRLTPFICAFPDLTAARLSAAETAARAGESRQNIRPAARAADAIAGICMVQVDRGWGARAAVEQRQRRVRGAGVRSTDGTSEAAGLHALSCGADALETRRWIQSAANMDDCAIDSCKSYYGPASGTCSVITLRCGSLLIEDMPRNRFAAAQWGTARSLGRHVEVKATSKANYCERSGAPIITESL